MGTDSMSALQALSRFPFKSAQISHVILKIRNLLLTCNEKGYTVVFSWVPGHTGISGNERVDQLANEAISCGDIADYCNYAYDLCALPKHSLQESWKMAWSISSQSKGKSFARIQNSIPSKPWFSGLKLSRRVTCILTRMRLGHVCSPVQLAKFGIVDSDLIEVRRVILYGRKVEKVSSCCAK
ncbi:jg26856 [Pararge aegeria aegeria]|uniref:Jg26856 protein n=1 Tax=Pararge aegeria aegeria TaxID=348720 RepID=A0A8S4S999_9NEOP|nr:jg26856 [Pararge aegeria aegeria]